VRGFSIRKIGIIGAGRFGRAFIEGILKSKKIKSENIWALDRSEECRKKVSAFGVKVVESVPNDIVDTDLIVVAVKPAQIEDAIALLNLITLSNRNLILSVAAGTSVSKIEKLLNSRLPVVRAMPNSPCAVQAGFTAICKGQFAAQTHINAVKNIFETLGKCLEIEEKYFDLVTALSGSGPAYFYFFMEAMIEAGVQAGLDHSSCVQLVSQTTLGAARMVQELNRSPSDLKADVATPGGCTIEALKILEHHKFSEYFKLAIEEATRVASRLGKG
jgi:pyrroline-5-carboxylate reductase